MVIFYKCFKWKKINSSAYRFFTSQDCKFFSVFTAVCNIKGKLKEKLKYVRYLLFPTLTPNVFVPELDIMNVNVTSQISLYL